MDNNNSIYSNEDSENQLDSIKDNKNGNESSPIKINKDILNSDKMREDLKDYIMDHRRKVYERIEGMEPEEESSLQNQLFLNRPHYGNIGSNIVLFNKYVLGIKDNLIIYILTNIGMSLTWFGWVFSTGNFYSLYIYIFCGISYFLTLFFMFLSFIIEPGIIPRKCPEFSKLLENNYNNLRDSKKENNEGEEKDFKLEENINNSNNGNEIKNNKNEDDKKEIIPRIFRERKCITCNIIRPPGASHCRTCDNCVLGFDHHCYYISNCVGKRNHKYFYLFLFFGTISGIEVSIFNFITIFYVFIIKAKETIFILYKGNKFYFILSVILMTIGLIYGYCGARDILFVIIPSLIGIIIFIRMWYKYIYISKNIPYYYNPFILIVFVSVITFCIFVTATFVGQTIHISSGFTIKQTKSIINEMIDLSHKHPHNEINHEYTREKNYKERLNNIIKFLKADIEKSLIVPERDLFK